METKNYKYIVTIETTAWDNSIDKEIEDKSTTQQIEFSNEDPLVARQLALKKAKSIIEYFEDENEDHILPPMKWTENFTSKDTSKDITLWMFYQVKVEFKHVNKSYCIYDTGDAIDNMEEVLDGLKKEYEILKSDGINLKKETQIIKYFDHKDKKNKKANILKNGMDLNGIGVNIIYGIDWDNSEKNKKTIKQKKKKKPTSKNRKSDAPFRSTYKNRFKIKRQNFELTMRTTLQTIPSDIERDIEDLIKKWTAKK
jgi:hypothetical protein